MLVQTLSIHIIIVLFIQPIVSYLRDKNRLRHFPSPPYTALSSLWRIHKNWQYKHFPAVHDAHKQLGIHVRIAPNHVSISDPQALQDTYGHGANFLKDAWYDGGAGDFRHVADARVKSEHQAKRKLLAHVFAQKMMANMEPVIADTVSTLMLQVGKAAESKSDINMRRYLNYFTIDVFSRLLYGESFSCLERDNDIVDARNADSKIYKVPFIKSLHESTMINTILGMEAPLLPVTKQVFSYHPYKKAGADYENTIYHNAVKRLQAVGLDSDSDTFAKLLTNNKGEAVSLCLGDILAESSVMMNAGTDTTTAHSEVLARLQEELDQATETTEIPSYESLSSLIYLRACIEESLRVRPASSMGLPRVVPKGGRTIAGQFIAEGVTVSVPTYTLLRDPAAFEEPDEFRPDRWLTGNTAKMAKAHFAFSTGPRACIGRDIAYFEQLLVTAALVKGWDFDFVVPNFELKTLERFNGNPDEMVMNVQRRRFV